MEWSETSGTVTKAQKVKERTKNGVEWNKFLKLHAADK